VSDCLIVWRTKAREAIVSNVNGGGRLLCRLCQGMEAYTVLRGRWLLKKGSKERECWCWREKRGGEERRGEERRGEGFSDFVRRCGAIP
jgi:hypothetical protein